MMAKILEVVEPTLDQVVRKILSSGSPEKIILFGSHARGEARPDSDLDLLIIEDADPWKQASVYRSALQGLGYDFDIKVRSPREVASWRNVPNHFLTTIVREGKVLYGRDLVGEEPEPTNDQADHAREWMEFGDGDLEVAELTLKQGGPLWAVAFHAQQAAEKYLKAVFAYRGAIVPPLHSLAELQGLLTAEPHQIVIEGDLQKLSGFAVDGRYPRGPLVEREEAERFVGLARSIRQQVSKHLPKRASP